MIRVSAHYLDLMLPHVSNDKTRECLGGVLFRRDGVLVATNGVTLAAASRAWRTENLANGVTLRFPAQARKLVAKAAKVERRMFEADHTKGPTDMTLEISAADGWVLRSDKDIAVLEKIDSLFPKWELLFHGMREFHPTPLVVIDPQQLKAFPYPVRLSFTKPEHPILVETRDPNFVGLIMPANMNRWPMVEVPTWSLKAPD